MKPARDEELRRLWKLLQYNISSDFVLAYFKDAEINTFHDYASKELYNLEKKLEDEFIKKFVKDE